MPVAGLWNLESEAKFVKECILEITKKKLRLHNVTIITVRRGTWAHRVFTAPGHSDVEVQQSMHMALQYVTLALSWLNEFDTCTSAQRNTKLGGWSIPKKRTRVEQTEVFEKALKAGSIDEFEKELKVKSDAAMVMYAPAEWYEEPLPCIGGSDCNWVDVTDAILAPAPVTVASDRDRRMQCLPQSPIVVPAAVLEQILCVAGDRMGEGDPEICGNMRAYVNVYIYIYICIYVYIYI